LAGIPMAEEKKAIALIMQCMLTIIFREIMSGGDTAIVYI